MFGINVIVRNIYYYLLGVKNILYSVVKVMPFHWLAFHLPNADRDPAGGFENLTT